MRPGGKPAAAGGAGPPRQVRIIGGSWRRTPIPVASAPGLRPTPDRVRETVFNWINHLLPDLGQVRGLDLFAGTGALGLELASRGALRVVLVERNPRLAAALQRLRERLAAPQVEVLAGDGLRVVLPPAGFELVFLDPPFDDGLMPAALARARTLVAPGGLVYAEAGAPLSPAALGSAGFEAIRAGHAGQVHFHLLRAAGS